MRQRRRRAWPRRWRGGTASLYYTGASSRLACYAFFSRKRTGGARGDEKRWCSAGYVAASVSSQHCLLQGRAASCSAPRRWTSFVRASVSHTLACLRQDAVLGRQDGSRGFGRGRGSAGGSFRRQAAPASNALASSAEALVRRPRRHRRQRTGVSWKAVVDQERRDLHLKP